MTAVGEGAPGTLHVVSTPIGHLGDLSPRAIEVLRGVAKVLNIAWIADALARRGITVDRHRIDLAEPLELEPDEQEEHRHQTVIDPVFERQRPDIGVQHRCITRSERRVGDDERNHRGGHENQSG